MVSKLETGNGKLSFYGYDGHGSVRQLTDSTGAITDTYDYDAFGNLIASTGTSANNYLFAGEQYDSDLGLYYNRTRYLDVRQGRFWGVDTYEGDPQSPLSLHKYLYLSADPANRIDPSGRFGLDETVAANGIAAQLNTQSFLNAYPILKKAIPRGSTTDKILSVVEIGLAVVSIYALARSFTSLAGFARNVVSSYRAVETDATVAEGALAVGADLATVGEIEYGSSDLSQAAISLRQTEGISGGRNVAVFEYRAADGSLQQIAATSDRTIGLHAERIIGDKLTELGVDPSQVTRIYSELQPCSIPTAASGCAAFVNQTFPQARVTWSFEYGVTQESRAAGLAALTDAVKNITGK